MTYFFPLLIDYPFTGDIENSKIVSLYCTDVIKGGADHLRNEMGNYWWKKSPLYGGDPSIEYNILPVETGVLDIRGWPVDRMSTESSFFEKVEMNPFKIKFISNDTYIPNYKIPIRIYASETETRGDLFWQALFKGGEWGGQTYKSIIDDKRIFYDEAFSFKVPYSTLDTKLMSAIPFSEVFEATSEYVYYNENIAKYQAWAHSLESELLMPLWYSYTSVAAHMDYLIGTYGVTTTAGGIPTTSEMQPEAYPENKAFWAQEKPFLEYWRPSQRAETVHALGSEPAEGLGLGETTYWSTMDSDHLAFWDELTLNFLGTVCKDGSRAKNEDQIAFNIQNFDRLSATTKNKVIEKSKNVILSEEYWQYEPDDYVSKTAQTFPYYTKIRFPRSTAGPPGGESDAGGDPTLTETINTNYVIRDSIADNHFSAKFLETLKDIHDGEFTTTRFGTKTFISEKNFYEGSNYSGYADIEAVNELGHTQLRALDFTYMIAEIYNQHGSSVNENYYLAGPSLTTYESISTDTDLYRFQDNQNALEVLKDTSKMLQNYMNISGYVLDSPGAMGSYSIDNGNIKYTWDPNVEFREASRPGTTGQKLLESLLNPSYKHTEVLAYRVEKKRANRVDGQTSRETIQNFWIFNSDYAEDDITLYDTQVKYDQDYTYIGYAYMLVLGHRYRYGDYRLTKQIGTINSDPDTPGVEYYCLQFYDPKTSEFADQLFWDGSGLDALDSGYGEDPISSALAGGVPGMPGSANEFATSRQELSVHPQLADCHFYVEPCLKLVEIPIFSKTFKVLDNPANDMITIPFQYIDNSHRVGFNTLYESFLEEPYPQCVTSKDKEMKEDYLHAKDLLGFEDVIKQSESPPRYVEIFRIDKVPTSYEDFENHSRGTTDLLIKDSAYTYSQAVLSDKLIPNKKYYYLFRFLNENKIPGHLSQILECELIDDGGYIYSKFNTIEDSDMIQQSYINPSTSFKKILQLKPHVSQLTLDTTDVDFSATAGSQLENLSIGVADDPLWEKTFKLRLTSRKTGKQLDLNVEFKMKKEDKFSESLT